MRSGSTSSSVSTRSTFVPPCSSKADGLAADGSARGRCAEDDPLPSPSCMNPSASCRNFAATEAAQVAPSASSSRTDSRLRGIPPKPRTLSTGSSPRRFLTGVCSQPSEASDGLHRPSGGREAWLGHMNILKRNRVSRKAPSSGQSSITSGSSPVR